MSPAITTQTWLNEFFTCSARANPRQCAKVDSSHARRRDGKSINPSSAHHFYTCACVKGVEAGRLVCESLHPINMKLSCSVPFRSNRGRRSLTALGVRTQNGLRERENTAPPAPLCLCWWTGFVYANKSWRVSFMQRVKQAFSVYAPPRGWWYCFISVNNAATISAMCRVWSIPIPCWNALPRLAGVQDMHGGQKSIVRLPCCRFVNAAFSFQTLEQDNVSATKDHVFLGSFFRLNFLTETTSVSSPLVV